MRKIIIVLLALAFLATSCNQKLYDGTKKRVRNEKVGM